MNLLGELNRANSEQAASIILPLIERAPHIARKVANHRPFETAQNLKDAIRDELFKLSEAEQLSLFQAHPELAPNNPLAMTAQSQSEQERFGLTEAESFYKSELSELNALYQAKFGFPFITALILHADMDSVMIEFKARLANDRLSETQQTMKQICAVSEARVDAAFGFEEPATSEVQSSLGGPAV